MKVKVKLNFGLSLYTNDCREIDLECDTVKDCLLQLKSIFPKLNIIIDGDEVHTFLRIVVDGTLINDKQIGMRVVDGSVIYLIQTLGGG